LIEEFRRAVEEYARLMRSGSSFIREAEERGITIWGGPE